MSFVTKFQAESMSPVLFTMNKDLLKLIPKIAADPFYGNDANWFRVSFVFKHTQSRKRFVPSFLNFSSTKRLKVRSGMNGGDEYTLKKIILSKSDRSHFVIFESEIPDVANFNFALLGEGAQPDVTSPIMTSITGPAAGEYSAGDALNFYLNFDEPVFVSGQPKLYLDIDFVYKEAGYISGSGSSSLLFRYIVGSSDNDSEGIQIDSFNLNGGTIKDASDNNASINVASQSLNLITIQNDLTAPVLNSVTSSSPALLVTGDILNVSVNFSEAVIVSGAPTLMLDLGGVSRIADYSNTDGSSVIFNYTVGPADTAQYSVMVNEISLNGGTIQDASGNNAGIIFSPVTINSQVNPDVVAPALEDIIILNNSESPFFTNDVIQFVAEFSESVNYTGSPRLVLSINSQTKYANIVSSSGSNLLFEYTVTSQDIGDVIIYSVDLNGGTIKDDVENNATLLLEPITGSISINPDIVSPTVLSVTGVEGDYSTGDSIEFTVQFSENIQVTNSGSVKLSLSLDSGTVLASLSSVSGSTATFSYTVTSADQEATSLTISSISLGVNGSIADSAGNAANLSFSPISKAIIINEVLLEPQIYRIGSRGTFDGTVHCITQQSDGKLVVVGSFTFYNNTTANRIVRLNTDNSIDSSFATGTGFQDVARSIVQQSDGKLVIGGSFTSYNGTTINRIVRLNTNGSIDSSFAVGTGFNSDVYSVVQQSDGKIIVGGSFTSYNGTTINRIVRLNTNGSIDSSFAVGAGFTGTVNCIILQSDNKPVVGGQFPSYNGVTVNNIVRLNTNGSRDTTFVTGTGFNNPVNCITQQSDGKFVFAGSFTTYNSAIAGMIVRLNTNGSRDTTFATGNGFNAYVRSIIQQPDGKLVVVGNFLLYNTTVNAKKIARLNTDGSIDSSFATGNGFNNSSTAGLVNFIIQQSDGKLVVGGQFSSYNNITADNIVRLNTDGSFFDLSSYNGFDNSVISIVQQSDGKLVIGGQFTFYNSTIANRIVRLKTNGIIDTDFITGTGFDNIVNCITQQSDGKIIVGGSFTSYNGTTINRIVRLNTDGSRDTTFVTGTGFNNPVNCITQQSDGKLVVAGAFTSYNGTTINRIVRLNTNGSIDSSFATGTGLNGLVQSMAQQSDGKFIVSGPFSTYNSAGVSTIIRLNTNGSRDTSFSTGNGFTGTVYSIFQQSDGKLVVGGDFIAYNGVTVNNIVRLNTNGSRDTTFVTGTIFNSVVRCIVQQSDGKLVVGGSFFNNTTVNRIVRLNTNGSIDSSFAVGTGFNTSTLIITQQSDGKLVIGGAFANYQQIPFSRIVRIEPNGELENI